MPGKRRLEKGGGDGEAGMGGGAGGHGPAWLLPDDAKAVRAARRLVAGMRGQNPMWLNHVVRKIFRRNLAKSRVAASRSAAADMGRDRSTADRDASDGCAAEVRPTVKRRAPGSPPAEGRGLGGSKKARPGVCGGAAAQCGAGRVPEEEGTGPEGVRTTSGGAGAADAGSETSEASGGVISIGSSDNSSTASAPSDESGGDDGEEEEEEEHAPARRSGGVWDELASRARRLSPPPPPQGRQRSSPDRKPPVSAYAVDCEMVGAGPGRKKSLLARVAVVDTEGEVLLDTYVRPTERVTDYRTRWSGIRPGDLVGAPAFQDVRQRVASLVRGKLLVGHAIDNDLRALQLPHPPALTRDTSVYPPLRAELCGVKQGYDMSQAPSLKALSEGLLGHRIQGGEHCPVEDSRATMRLYMRHRERWEAELM